MRRRGDGCGRGGGSGRRRPGREMRRGLPAPSDSSRVKSKARTRTWCGEAAPGLALSGPCRLALSLLALQWAVGDLRVRLENRSTGCSSGRLCGAQAVDRPAGTILAIGCCGPGGD